MSTEFDPPEQTEPPDTQTPMEPAPSTDSGMPEVENVFSSSEGMISLAGAILILDWLIFGVLANDYWISWVPLTLAIMAVLLPRLDRGFVEQIAPISVLMKAVGYLIAAIGLVTIIEDLRFTGTVFDEFLGIVGALVAYAAFALALLGARGIDT